MSEVATFRKNKIELTEYDYIKDIQNRTLMASFSSCEVDVLEEILYSSLRIPLSVLEQNLHLTQEVLLPILEKLSQTGLFKVSYDHVLVEKEMRKYYEFQILKFEEDFKPGMEYLQSLLRKVPIHVLPSWYSISRTSNNIFESIVEKYLETPQIFQRYLMDLSFSDPIQQEIMDAVYQSPSYEINAYDIMRKYSLTQEEFEKHMLHLEFNFVCCVKFEKDKEKFKQIITPFQEWKEYLHYVHNTKPSEILEENSIQKYKTSSFAVVEEMSAIVALANKKSISKIDITAIQKICPEFHPQDFSYYMEKLSALHLITKVGQEITSTKDSAEWLKMDLPNRALYLYRHPLNYLKAPNVPEELCEHRIIREAEKSVSCLATMGWVYLEDFIKGIVIPLKEEHAIHLNRQGKAWKYKLPEYSKEECAFFKAIIQHWLFEFGITALGIKKGRECFTLTSLGKELFSND